MSRFTHSLTTFSFDTKAGIEYTVKFARTPTQKKQVTVWEGDKPIDYVNGFYGSVDARNALHILEQAIVNKMANTA